MKEADYLVGCLTLSTKAVKKCIHCGEHFRTRRVNQVYCSLHCGNAYRVAQHRERKRASLS